MIFKKKKFLLTKDEFIRFSYFSQNEEYIVYNSGYKHYVECCSDGIKKRCNSVGLGQAFLKNNPTIFMVCVKDYIKHNFLHPVPSDKLIYQQINKNNELKEVEVLVEKEEFISKKLIDLKDNFPRKITYHFVNKEQKSIFFDKNGLFQKFEERDQKGNLIKLEKEKNIEKEQSKLF